MEPDRIKITPFLIVIAVVCLAEAAVGYAVQTGSQPPLIVIGLGRLAETLLILGIARAWGGGLPSLGLAPSTVLPGLKKGLMASAAFGTLTAVGFIGLMVAGLNPFSWIHTNLPSAPKELITFLIVGTIVGPLAEEVFFRGVIYGFFRRWGIAAAMVLSTTLFVLAHPAGFAAALPRIAGGLLFAAAYEMTGSLAAPMTIHALGNLAIFSLPLLVRL